MRLHTCIAILTLCLSIFSYPESSMQDLERLHPDIAKMVEDTVASHEPIYFATADTETVERVLEMLQYTYPEIVLLRLYLSIDMARIYYNNRCSIEDANRCLTHGYAYIAQLPTRPRYRPVVDLREYSIEDIVNERIFKEAIHTLKQYDVHDPIIYFKIVLDIKFLYDFGYCTEEHANNLIAHFNTQYITAVLESKNDEQTYTCNRNM